MKQNSFSTFILLILLVSCLDEKEIESNYPKVSTSSVSEISTSGALFTGIIEPSQLDEVSEYGFVWGQYAKVGLENSFSVKFGKPTDSKASAKIRSTLVAQKIYYVRFYIKAGGKTIYGNVVSFKSLGSEGPFIKSISPGSGVLGDTVTIQGRNFINREYGTEVKFGWQPASILSSTDTTIIVKVPEDLSLLSEYVEVSVEIEGNIAKSPVPFRLLLSKLLPRIESISPLQIKAGDTILVVGKNFKRNSSIIELVLPNNQPLNLIKATDDSIHFSIIDLLPQGEFGFTIKSGKYEVISNVDFIEVRPEFTSISSEMYELGGTLTINVKNFPTHLPVFASYLGNYLNIISMTENELKVIAPEFCNTTKEPIQFGISSDNSFLSTIPITSVLPQIFSVEPSHGTRNQAVVIHGDNFYNLTPYFITFLEVESHSKTEIRGYINEVYAPHGLDVVVEACNYSVTLPNAFQFDPPEILDINPKVITSPDQIITIEGNNFSTNVNMVYATERPELVANTITDFSYISFPASFLIPDTSVDTKFSTKITVRAITGKEGTSSVALTVDYDAP